MKRGFFGERQDSGNIYYAEYFVMLKAAFARVCETDLSQYRKFRLAVEAGLADPNSTFVWRWIDKEAYLKISRIVKLVDKYIVVKPRFVESVLVSSIETFAWLTDGIDYRTAVDALTAEIDSVCFYMQTYDDHCRDNKETVSDEVLEIGN